jgi:very-short-patch-repair endonuclease
MGVKIAQRWSARAWELTRRQHGVVTRAQLLELGLTPKAIQHRLETGRLHPLMLGAYSVGRPEVSERGWWMAAVLVCGPDALLSHRSAAALWGIRRQRSGLIEVTVPDRVSRRRPELRVHRRRQLDGRRREVDGIPVTDPICTLVDLATCVPDGEVEAAINEADFRDLVDPEALRAALDSLPRWPGVGRLRRLLDRETLALATTELERLFLRILSRKRLPLPDTQRHLGGHRVDFYWTELGLVVETDSLRYHRSAFKQSADMRRDHDHVSAGRTTLRFSHAQVKYEPAYVGAVLAWNIKRLGAAPRLGDLHPHRG